MFLKKTHHQGNHCNAIEKVLVADSWLELHEACS